MSSIEMNASFKLKDILITTEEYTLDELKKELGLTSDKSLINFLLRFLSKELNNLHYVIGCDENQANDIINIIDIIYSYFESFVMEKRHCDINNLKIKLNMIGDYIDHQLQSCRSQKEPKNLFAHKLWTQIAKKNKNVSKFMDDYIAPTEQCINQQMLDEIIYNVRSLSLIEDMYNHYPKIFLEYYDDGTSIFTKLLNFYLNLLLNDDTKLCDLIYFESVINLFLKKDSLITEKEYKHLISRASEKIKLKKTLIKKEREQRIIFLDHLRKKLQGDKKYVENIRELNAKYCANIVTGKVDSKPLEQYFKNTSELYHNFAQKDVITIDPAGSVELDDGISLEKLNNNNYLLGIYIADVSNYVPFNSCNDIEALQRGTSIYLPKDAVIPMIPYEISTAQCSFLPKNLTKKAICYFFELEPDGNILRSYYAKGYIRPRKENCLSYDDASRILSSDNNNSKLFLTLQQLKKFSKLIFTNGLEDEGEIYAGSEPHEMVAKYMILANHKAALDAKKKGVPFLYRTYKRYNTTILQTNPAIATFVNNRDTEYDVNIIKEMLGKTSKAYYTTEGIGHDGLGLSAYAHTTSPIRRYADLANQRLIKKFFIDQNIDDKLNYKIEKSLKSIADCLNNNCYTTEQYLNDYAHVLRK